MRERAGRHGGHSQECMWERATGWYEHHHGVSDRRRTFGDLPQDCSRVGARCEQLVSLESATDDASYQHIYHHECFQQFGISDDFHCAIADDYNEQSKHNISSHECSRCGHVKCSETIADRKFTIRRR